VGLCMWGGVAGLWLGLGFWGWNWGVFTELCFKLFPCLICSLGRIVVGVVGVMVGGAAVAGVCWCLLVWLLWFLLYCLYGFD